MHLDVARINELMRVRSARERVVLAVENLPSTHIVSSSFAIQSAATLHLLTSVIPDVPVVIIDTGYLFPETYRFIDALRSRLQLNLVVYRTRLSPAWQEARHGARWEQGESQLATYNLENKVKPMQEALDELQVGTWFAGIRAAQTEHRRSLDFVERQGGLYKVHPVLDWSDREVHDYLKRHALPYHPLREQGYISVGDVHSTRALRDVDDASQLRFNGLKRECGLHEMIRTEAT